MWAVSNYTLFYPAGSAQHKPTNLIYHKHLSGEDMQYEPKRVP